MIEILIPPLRFIHFSSFIPLTLQGRYVVKNRGEEPAVGLTSKVWCTPAVPRPTWAEYSWQKQARLDLQPHAPGCVDLSWGAGWASKLLKRESHLF